MRALAATGLLALVAVAAGQVAGDPSLSMEAETEANVRRERIDAEVKRLGAHEWAGHYFAGNGYESSNLSLAPQAGYEWFSFSCTGYVARNFGSVSVEDGRLQLELTYPAVTGRYGLSGELVLVPWGARRYLVSTDELIGFCNAVNQGEEPRRGVEGEYLLRARDHRHDVAGPPEVPATFAKYILESPVEAIVLAIGRPATRDLGTAGRWFDTPLTLDAGATRGLLPAMELVLLEPAGRWERIQILEVTADRAEARLTQSSAQFELPAAIGWRFSTQSSRADG